jgi:predicted secreted hydrolase
MNGRRLAALALVTFVIAFAAGCGGAPILANPPAQRPAATRPPMTETQRPADPQPVVLPRDDAPHDRLTEWWYYTGHLADASGATWGFEFVVFRAERGAFPVSWASHLALTDERGNRFMYAQRTEIGQQVDVRPDSAAPKFDFAIGGAGGAWQMSGSDGTDRLVAAASVDEVAGSGVHAPFGIDLRLAARGPVALHDRDGWIDFEEAGSSYYYSRTSMSVAGSISVDGKRLDVEGRAWFDHQWGDFIAVGGGGWDWFAINLDDGTDIALSLVRDGAGRYPLVYGTVVTASGTTHLEADEFEVAPLRQWRSPATGITYPAGWRITLPMESLVINLAPTVADQELDTRASSGVVYWEGSQRVTATRNGKPVSGDAYVELTGYGP